MKDITKKYTNGEVTIVWKPNTCTHSAVCFKGLGEVFHPQELPWITPEKSTTDKIVEQVKKCPSGALSFYTNSDANKILNPVCHAYKTFSIFDSYSFGYLAQLV